MAVDVGPLIAAAQKRADDLTKAAVLAASQVGNVYGGQGREYNSTLPHLRQSPPPFTGSTDISSEIKQAFHDAFGLLGSTATDALTVYFNKFFPECIVNNTNSWICNTILYGGSGLPPGIENAIWQRAKEREVQESLRMQMEATQQFASRGFVLPPGAMAERLLQVQQDLTNKVSMLSRETAIKNLELQIENIRLAVAEGIKVRLAVITSLSEFVKAAFMPATLAIQYADTIASAKQKLVGAAADYYRAMISEAEMDLKSQEITASSQTQVSISDNTVQTSALTSNAVVRARLVDAYTQAAAAAGSAAMSLASAENITFQSATAT